MKSAKAPDPPDPTKTIAAQTASNKDTAGYQQSMNLIDQNTPLGSLRYTNVGTDPTTGAPKYQSDVSLTPSGQRSFDLQQQVSEALNNLALKGSGQVSGAFDKPQSYDGLPSLKSLDLSKLKGLNSLDLSSLPGVKSYDPSKLDLSGYKAPTANEEDYKQAQDALRKQFTSRLDPQWQAAQKDLETKLTNQGIHQNSEAWNQAMDDLGRQRTDAYQTADNNAVTGATGIQQAQWGMKNTGFQEDVANALRQYDTNNQNDLTAVNLSEQQRQARLNEQLTGHNVDLSNRQQGVNEELSSHNVDLSNRQQGITEANYLRELPINEISSLLNGGQVSTPSFSNTPQTQVGGTNVAGIIQGDFDNRNAIYQTQQASNNAAFGAIAGLAGSALGGWATGGFKA